jgi:hypothetical protein
LLRWLPRLAAAVALSAGVGTSSAQASPTVARATGTTITLFAQVTKEQFVNNRDDRQRGTGNNPFGNSAGTGTATTNEHVGPLPGDEGMFEFAVYHSASLTHNAGTGAFVCQFAFDKSSVCDLTYSLEGGSVVGVGTFEALTTAPMSFTVTGGTGKYLGARGTLNVATDTSTNAPGSQTVTHTVPALLLQAQRLTFSLQQSTAGRRSSLYSVAKQEQFIDNDDDEARGWTTNPFGMRDPQVEKSRQSGDGPFPGDESLFGFAVYSSSQLKQSSAAGTYTCNYYFDRTAFCDATYRFANGTLYAAGAFSFDAKSYTLAVTGGTGRYQDATGELESLPGPNHSQRLNLTLGVARQHRAQTLVLASVATDEQFVNNSDDRLRGNGKNPFGNFHDNTPTTKQAKGPFPGDEALYRFTVYANDKLKEPVGSATFACAFNFNKNMYCDAIYTLKSGTIVASGAFNFATQAFSFAVTGGTGAYEQLTGVLNSTPGAHDSQHLVFALN